VRIRTLRAHEREELLALLDLWPQSDGWRGRDFFRRYVEQDESYEDENVVVAERDGRLVACVQVFPRPVLVRGRAVPMGGIGSVFTHPELRGRGLARRLLDLAVERMRERGCELSLLFGVRPMYEPLGWRSWQARAWLLSLGGRPVTTSPGLRIEPFEATRDLDDVRALHDRYSGGLDGTVVRDQRLWRTSLRVAGNPREEFRVARREGELVAYVRAVVINSFLAFSELGRHADAVSDLVALVESVLVPREHDPLAPPQRPSPELRGLVALPCVADPALAAGLRARGLLVRSVDDPSVRWRCLDPAALAERLGVDARPGEDAAGLLARVFPPGRFTYWRADRF
jgi:predicted N-acetyltransferase YhbS